MPTVSLQAIPTVDRVVARDQLNLEVLKGKFGASHKVGLSAMSSMFMDRAEADGYDDQINGWTAWLQRFVYGDGSNYGIVLKETMDGKFLFLSESKFYRDRLLTGPVMSALCMEYATSEMLSALLDNARQKGLSAATELGNALARLAAIMKSQAIMSDTDTQTTGLLNEARMEAASAIAEGLAAMNAAIQAAADAAAAAQQAAEDAAAAAAGAAAQGEMAGGGRSKKPGTNDWYVFLKKPAGSWSQWGGGRTEADAISTITNWVNANKESRYDAGVISWPK